MSDIDTILARDGQVWRRAVDHGARPSPGTRHHGPQRRHTPLLIASALVVVAAIVATALAVTLGRHRPDPATPPVRQDSGSVTVLRRYTWSVPDWAGSVIFGDTTANINYGCTSGLHRLTIHGHTLTIGPPVGGQTTCSGAAGNNVTGSATPPAGPPTFDQIVHGRLRWSINRNKLTLTRPDGASLTLRRSAAPAPSIIGTRWTLGAYEDSAGHERKSPTRYITFLIRNGRLHATDSCNDITADATITPTTVRFSHVTNTDRGCPPVPFLPVGNVVDQVLDGSRPYRIYDDRELIIGTGKPGLLIYRPNR